MKVKIKKRRRGEGVRRRDKEREEGRNRGVRNTEKEDGRDNEKKTLIDEARGGG